MSKQWLPIKFNFKGGPICTLYAYLQNWKILFFVWELFSWVRPNILIVQNSKFCPDNTLQSKFMFSVIYFLWKLEKTITKFGLAPKSTWLKVNTFKYTFFKLKKISKPDNSLKGEQVLRSTGHSSTIQNWLTSTTRRSRFWEKKVHNLT